MLPLSAFAARRLQQQRAMEWTQELDAIAARLDALEGQSTRRPSDLEAVFALLQDQVTNSLTTVEESVSLSRIAARADENVQLARLALESDGEGEAGALFHLRRTIQLLRDLDAEILGRTRDIDRAKNRRDFISG